jgi:hypothetical protein
MGGMQDKFVREHHLDIITSPVIEGRARQCSQTPSLHFFTSFGSEFDILEELHSTHESARARTRFFASLNSSSLLRLGAL